MIAEEPPKPQSPARTAGTSLATGSRLRVSYSQLRFIGSFTWCCSRTFPSESPATQISISESLPRQWERRHHTMPTPGEGKEIEAKASPYTLDCVLRLFSNKSHHPIIVYDIIQKCSYLPHPQRIHAKTSRNSWNWIVPNPAYHCTQFAQQDNYWVNDRWVVCTVWIRGTKMTCHVLDRKEQDFPTMQALLFKAQELSGAGTQLAEC